MRLITIENNIKQMIIDDINNPELYNEIYKLSYYYLMRRKLLSTAEYASEVAHIMAEDLYMKILSGDTIHSWLGYISKYYHGAIRTWRKMCASEVIEAEDNVDLQNAIINMSISNGNYNEHYDKILDNIYIESITSIVDFILQNSRYMEYTDEYLSAKLTILISLIRGRFIKYNLSSAEVNYTRLLYNKVKYTILNNVVNNSHGNEHSNLTLLQLYTISNNETESE